MAFDFSPEVFRTAATANLIARLEYKYDEVLRLGRTSFAFAVPNCLEEVVVAALERFKKAGFHASYWEVNFSGSIGYRIYVSCPASEKVKVDDATSNTEVATTEATEEPDNEATEEKTFSDIQERLDYYRKLRRAEGPGEGYRFMASKEPVVEGDEFDDGKKEKPIWRQTINLISGKQTSGCQYRRRNQFTYGELVRVVKPLADEQEEYPYWNDLMNHLDGKVFEMPAPFTEKERKIICDPRDLGVTYLAVDWLAPASQQQKADYAAAKASKPESDGN